MPNLSNLKCVECERSNEPMLVFVGAFRYEDGTIENIPEGMHPYCDPCRENLNISDELNAGRDLRAEARQAVLDAVEETQADKDDDQRLDIIYDVIDAWVGGTDSIFGMLGRRTPTRPQEVFDGVSDAFGELDPTKMSVVLSLGLITAANTVEDRIPNWKDFVQRTYKHLQETLPDRADAIMKGFL